MIARILFICYFITISTVFAEQSLKDIFDEKNKIENQKKIFCDNEQAKIDSIIEFLKSEFDFYSYSKEKLEEKWKQKTDLANKLEQMSLSLDIENELGGLCKPYEYGSFIGDGLIVATMNRNICWVDERKLILRVEYKGRKYRGEESCILYPDEREIANVIKNAYAKALNEVDIQKGQQKLEKQKKCLSGCTTKKGAAYDICINDCKRIYGGTK